MLNKLLIISGPTASGKTALALKIAKKYHGELISADSRQIYQGMDIGTGKDRQSDIPVHLIDLITPNQAFSVAQYQRLALIKVKELQQKDILPIVVGGTDIFINGFEVFDNKFSADNLKITLGINGAFFDNIWIRKISNHMTNSITLTNIG